MPENSQHNRAPEGYEEKDVNTLKIFGYFAAGTIIVVIVLIFLIDFFIATKEEVVYEAVLKPESVVLRELRAREEEELGSYSVLDEEKGVYRIPIERAMEIAADEAYGEEQTSGRER